MVTPREEDPDDGLDASFPLGDGVVETETFVVCPYCGEEVELSLDPGGGPDQSYIEDCEVCCRPWSLTVHWTADGEARVVARTTEE